VGITNVVGSTVSVKSNCGIHLNTGPARVGNEHLRCIKAFTSQFVALIMFGLVMSEDYVAKQERRKAIIQALENLPNLMEKVYQEGSADDSPLALLAKKLKSQKSLLMLSRGYMYGPCAEGALKIKEYCGIHAEACLSGEQGNLSIVSDNLATLMVIGSKDSPVRTRELLKRKNKRKDEDEEEEKDVHTKSLELLKEINPVCKPTVICGADDAKVLEITNNCILLPTTVDCLQGILTVMVMQLLTYHLAKK